MACDTPYHVRPNGYANHIPLPCGKCPPCKQRRTFEWAFRLSVEAQHSVASHFITLTYNDDNIPRSHNNFKSLQKKDCQDFFKRLRYYINDRYKIKYYLAGEYGDTTERPHYHLILTNLPKHDLHYINLAWQKGHIHVGDVNQKTIAYTLKYLDKHSIVPKHRRDDRQKEFSLKSRYIGTSYLTKANIEWHRRDIVNNTYVTNEEGYKVPLPKFFRDMIYTDAERKLIRKHITSKMEELEEKNRKLHKQNAPSISYDKYKETQAQARYKSFYNQNTRDYEHN